MTIKCKICGQEFAKLITNTHLKRHNMTVKQYKALYGDNSVSSEQYREEISKKYRGENNPNYGNSWSEKQKENLSEKLKGRESHNKGKKLSEEQKRKMSETKKKKFENGELTPPMLNKTLSDEAKLKISNSVKHYAENNPELLKERTKKARETFRENYGDYAEEFTKQNLEKARNSRSEQGKQDSIEKLINFNKEKKQQSINAMIERMKQYGYEYINIHISENGYEYVEYICPNNKIHTNTRQYFDNCRFHTDLTCKACITNKSSLGEKQVYEYVQSVISDTIYQQDKRLISPKELDIYIPSRNFAIEFNGLYYHTVENGKDELYHFDKFQKCRDNNVNLIQIFEDEWMNKPEIVKSIISSKLGIGDRKVYARNCSIVELTPKEAKQFVDDNHLYGYKKCSYKFGLYYGNELVQVMTFSRNNHSRKSNDWEIDRFCTKKYTQVKGGAGKLFKYFIQKVSPEKVASYSDLRYGEGKVYENIGFEFEKITKAGYFYFKPDSAIERIHRYKLRKTESENETGLTESELRNQQGFYRIYDAGCYKWVWSR